MDNYTLTEQAYKNGYKQGLKDAVKKRDAGCKYCIGLPREHMECFTMPNASTKDYDIITIKFCPNCGARMKG